MNTNTIKDGFYPHHACGICGTQVGYEVQNGEAYFDSSCDCSSYPSQPQLRPIEELKSFFIFEETMTSYNDSLIEKIENLAPPYRGFDSCVKRDEVLDIIRQHEAAQASEIPLVEKGTIEHLIKREIPRLLLALAEIDDVEDEVDISQELIMTIELALVQARDQLSAIRPYIRTPEPVSVAQCAKAAKGVFDLSLIGPDNGFKPEDVAKAVLDAAGVKYAS